MYWKIALICLFSYLTGAIPFAFIFVKLIKKEDLRKIGSGNVGATNAMRVLGWKLGLVVFILDFLKGAVCVLLIANIFGELNPFEFSPNFVRILSGVSGIIGHIWTVFLNFKGGKGVAASAGVFAVLLPVPFLISLAVFILLVAVFRYVSLGSITSAALFAGLTFVFENEWDIRIMAFILALLIILMHHSNIRRLVQGEEKKLSFTKK